jgi:hypothetical protein
LILSEAVKMKSIYAVDRSGDGKQTLSVLRLFREVKKDKLETAGTKGETVQTEVNKFHRT